MKKTLLFLSFLLSIVLLVGSCIAADTSSIQDVIANASTDDLLMLRELIDAELNQRFEALGFTPKAEINYVLNTNSKKFHIPSCDSVTKMKAKNKKEYKGDRQELIDMGYEPCGVCHP